MAVDNPIYATNGRMFYLGGRTEEISGECVVEGLQINRMNYRAIAREFGLPHSLLLSMISGKQYRLLDDSLKVCFADTESDEKDDFLLGYTLSINNGISSEFRRFDNPKSMVEEMLKYDAIVMFNSLRYDYPHFLQPSYPSVFDVERHKDFAVDFLKNKINIDALFFYTIFKPYRGSHVGDNLAADVGYTRNYGLNNRENKCKEDIEILVRFYPYLKEIYNFIVENFRMDVNSFSHLPKFSLGKLRRWMLQSYLIQHGILPKLVERTTDLKPDYFRYHKRGWHENLFGWDVGGAYPAEAIKLNCTLFKQGDFASYMRFLVGARKEHSTISEFLKYVANASIGDQGSPRSMLRDEKIMAEIWLSFKDRMEKWVKSIKKKNIAFGHTDGIMTTLAEVPPFPEDGFEVRLKNKIQVLYVWNFNRILYITDESKIVTTHFEREMSRLKFWRVVDKVVNQKLLSDPKAFLKNPEVTIDLKNDVSVEDLAITVNKTSDVCRSADLYGIWFELQFGWNKVFFGRRGLTDDPNKIDYRRYDKMVKTYVKQFKGRVEG